MNKYEAMIIFRESLKDEEQEQAVSVFKEEVKQHGGEVDSATRMGKRSFARPMKKQTAGQYVVVNLRMPGDQVRPLLDRLKLNDLFFRVQVVRASEGAPVSIAPPAEVED